MTRTITIIVQADGTFDVHEGERVANSLTFDEMLGELARIGHNQSGRYLRHIDDVLAERERSAFRRALYAAEEQARRDRGKCDGNHGGPRCADPECWNDSGQKRHGSLALPGSV